MMKINFYNGYCGCDIEEEFDGTYEEAVAWANEYLLEYAENYVHCAYGWDYEYTQEEFDDYFEGCYFEIEECEEND